jgi:hypothetical protein
MIYSREDLIRYGRECRAEALEQAAKLVGEPRNFKLNDGKSDLADVQRLKVGKEIRRLLDYEPGLESTVP